MSGSVLKSGSRRWIWSMAFGCFVCSLSLFVRPSVWAEGKVAIEALKADEVKFLRFNDEHKSQAKLETSIVTYRNSEGVTVRLVGAVHIGEKSYYEGLNDTFRGDDAVLYEMVKPKDMGAPKPNQESKSTVSKFQHLLKDVLHLDFQLDHVDYSRANFVHADLDAETFTKMQDERGESMFSLMLRQMMRSLTHPQEASAVAEDLPTDLIEMISRPDSERQIKLLLARHMGDAEKVAGGLDGEDGSVILSERNKAALKVLKDQLANGKKHISIFYGAAHMPSMSDTLQKDFGFKPIAIEWRTAWDLAIRADQPSLIESLLKDAVKMLDE